MTMPTDDVTQEQDFGRAIVRMISQLERRRRQFVNEGLRNSGLQGSQFMYLLALERYPGSSQDFLSEHLWIDKSMVARTVRKLEVGGYIQRELDAANRRQYRVELGQRGRELLPLIHRLLAEWKERVTQGMAEDERLETMRLLSHMIEQVALSDQNA